MTKTLCTQYIDSMSIEPLMASRLVPMDKGEGAVRPIGVGEVFRRIIGKCVINFAKKDVIKVRGSLQLCAGQKSGSEAVVHAMHTIFEADDTDAVLLIDTSNAFNVLNRAAAFRNIRALCPIVAVYPINTYGEPARLFVTGGKEIRSAKGTTQGVPLSRRDHAGRSSQQKGPRKKILSAEGTTQGDPLSRRDHAGRSSQQKGPRREILSAEGTTQGDPLAMALYALSIQLQITSLQEVSTIKQCWFADDASGAGSTTEIKRWWDTLSTLGPEYGYFPNDKKCWIIAKPDKLECVKEVFKETNINITSEGNKHLGAAIGSREYLDEYVSEVSHWVSVVVQLAEFALTQPQVCYAAYTCGLKHQWTYFLRTLPDIQDLLEPLENAISQLLIPAITEHGCK